MKTEIVSTGDVLTLSDLALCPDKYFIFAYSKNKLYGFILYDEDIEEWTCLKSSKGDYEYITEISLQDLYNELDHTILGIEIRYEKICE